MGGAIGGVVCLFVVITFCLLRSKRVEKRKRSAIEEQYRVVATTLTNITDSEDGCPYESVSMNDPTYRSDITLPTRKVKSGGISNGLLAFKRWVSFEGEMNGKDDIIGRTMSTPSPYDYKQPIKRSQPLPSIPEPPGSRRLMEQIDAYTEAGDTQLRTTRNKLEAKDSCPYDELRESLLIRDPSVKCNKSEVTGNEGYFTIEKVKNDPNKDVRPEAGNEYFTLETKDASEENDICLDKPRPHKPTYAVVRKSQDVSVISDVKQNEVNENNRCEVQTNSNKIEERQECSVNPGNQNNNAYFVLETVSLLTNQKATCDSTTNSMSVTSSSDRSSTYLEPVPKIDRNVYLDILPESTKL
ncbi:hypothetical protein FSP39_021186 [Pinctada imbricata]|uniref:Uncharacterized protein n=1 Tax=Pinctada imbricata TaxID=66713 RepID=A0AA89C792_PINIB|nr:hypothetical protein FSP39_021186 [Pinctada imbricata]